MDDSSANDRQEQANFFSPVVSGLECRPISSMESFSTSNLWMDPSIPPQYTEAALSFWAARLSSGLSSAFFTTAVLAAVSWMRIAPSHDDEARREEVER